MELQTAQWSRQRGWSRDLPSWDGDRTLVMVYGASNLLDNPVPLRELAARFPTSRLVGCSTAGEIHADTVSDETLTVAVARFASTRLAAVHRHVKSPDDSYEVGRAIGSELARRDEELRAIFVLSDGLAVNGSALTAGMVDGTLGRAIITGGLAGDGDRFERTWVLVDGEPQRAMVSAVGLSGPRLDVGHGSRGGWDIFGPERRVTRSEGNVLFELDGQPALHLYKTYLGDRASGLPATALLFPLAVRVPGAEERQLDRTIVGVDEETQSMTFAGDVPNGSLAQLMRANFDRLIDGAHAAAVATGSGDRERDGDGDGDGDATLAVAVSCVGRRLLLGRRTEDELDATLSGLPTGAELVGFYSYGEISPIAAGTCDLHNQTMTLTTFREGR
jgi:hypothetical protein